MTSLRKYGSWVIGVAAVCWAAFGFISILSKLHFVMDAWNWGVAQVPVSHKPILIGLRHHVSDWVASYHEFIHGLAQMLHLPKLPQFLYDTVGVIYFSIRWGVRVGAAAAEMRVPSAYTRAVLTNQLCVMAYHATAQMR